MYLCKKINRSPHGGPSELFLLPANAACLVQQRLWYVLSCRSVYIKDPLLLIRKSSQCRFCCRVSKNFFTLCHKPYYLWIKCVECIIKWNISVLSFCITGYWLLCWIRVHLKGGDQRGIAGAITFTQGSVTEPLTAAEVRDLANTLGRLYHSSTLYSR